METCKYCWLENWACRCGEPSFAPDEEGYQPIEMQCEVCGKFSTEVAANICLDCVYDNENMDRMYQDYLETQECKNDRIEGF